MRSFNDILVSCIYLLSEKRTPLGYLSIVILKEKEYITFPFCILLPTDYNQNIPSRRRKTLFCFEMSVLHKKEIVLMKSFFSGTSIQGTSL